MLELRGLTREFGGAAGHGPVRAVDNLSLEVGAGELVTLLGPSGCGKTTTLRLIAGFETPSAGTVHIAGRDVTRLPPQQRGTGMVFQNYALFPHLDVQENVAFGLRVRRASRTAIRNAVAAALDRVDLAGYERRRVQELSGGQQQRVALARALAPEPRVLLLDEPLSNLDAALRERTRAELRTLLEQVGITAIFVTHDQQEAFALADRIALLRHGRLLQYGTPERLYREPAHAFVAGFLGRATFVDGVVLAADDGRATCRVADVTWTARTAAPPPAAGAAVRLLLRPELLRIVEHGRPGSLAGIVTERSFAGALTACAVQTAAGVIVAHALGSAVVPERVGILPLEEPFVLPPDGAPDDAATVP